MFPTAPLITKVDFSYQGIHFSSSSFLVFAGLCAVDNQRNVEATFHALYDNGQVCSRMGAYKPRTSPYSFQGHGKTCLPYIFELAGKYHIKVIAMEITHDSQIQEIKEALADCGNPTGIILQIGTRNAQNFELLKAVGKQRDFPVLLKRGFGITLEESLHAMDYVLTEGNKRVIFCLRGVKAIGDKPHRNLVDFAQIPVIKRHLLMPICVDPSHAVGESLLDEHNISDIYHAAAQGVIAGANMLLVDFHPNPKEALVDRKQTLSLNELPRFLKDMDLVRQTYLARLALHQEAAQLHQIS